MINETDKQFLLTALPSGATVVKVGYCQERKQTYIALKHSLHTRDFRPTDFRLIKVSNKVTSFLRIDVIGGSPDILFSDFSAAKHHEFYLPRRPEMDAYQTNMVNDLTDQNVADLIQWAYKNEHLLHAS